MGACATAGEVTVLLCLLVSLLVLLLRNGFLLPAPTSPELGTEDEEMGIVTLRLAGARVMVRGVSGWDD